MPALTPNAIAELLEPYLGSAPISTEVFSQLAVYLELILKWNARINLTAIRQPEEIVRRHFGESLFAGLNLDIVSKDSTHENVEAEIHCDSLFDLGSGAGFPGIPIQLLRPNLPVILAESRVRKAAFLREVVRTLGLRTEVWAERAEKLPPERRFHTVALRAVDEMDSALTEASRRTMRRILILGTRDAAYPTVAGEFRIGDPIPIPNSTERVLWIAERD